MDHTEYWKNLPLAEELRISGTFLYNGMHRFHEMERLDSRADLFEVLYNLSVGFERLLKITVVFLEHDEATDQEKLEKSLITHNHSFLLKRIQKREKLNLSTPHNDFLCLLAKFYKSCRYDNYMLSSLFEPKKETDYFYEFLKKHLNVKIERKGDLWGVRNEDRYRKFIQKVILKISRELYNVIRVQASALRLYTYELPSESKAEAVF